MLIILCKNLNIVKVCFSKKVYNTVKEFSEADAVFVKGGGFIHAYGEKTAPYLMWFFLFYVRLAKSLGKKVVFLPNSYGPFEGLTVSGQVKSVFSKIDLVYARENVSSVKLGELLNRKIPVEMDLGFFLQENNGNDAVEILEKYNFRPSDKIVGVTIRPWRFPGKSNASFLYSKYLESVKELIIHIESQGFKIALCNQSLGINAHEDDRNAIRELMSYLEPSPNIIWINENLPCDILKTVYSKFYFFVGTRFHSVIFSLTSEVPSIAIGYGGNKAKGIMGDFNLNDFVVSIDEVTSEKLIGMFDKAIINYSEIKGEINKSISLIDESRNRMIADIKSLYK